MLTDLSSSIDLSIIFVNWNSTEYLRACLKSILANPPRRSFELIIVDNASTDRKLGALKAEFPAARVVESAKNLGFVGANNLGYKLSSGRTLFFLNPDTEIVGTAIDHIWDALDSLPAAGIVGCKLLNSDGSVQTSCIQRFPTILNQLLDFALLQRLSSSWRVWGISPLFSKSEKASEVEVVSGAALMIKRATFEQVGGFSTDYFMYAEDVDLCYKCRATGAKNYFTPLATIVHHGGGSSRHSVSGWAAAQQRQSIMQFLVKTRGPLYAFLYRASTAVASALRLGALALVCGSQKLLRSPRAHHGAVKKWHAVFKWAWTAQLKNTDDGKQRVAGA